MAAEVPAETVLCEAMEYLSRLGTNLHTRSVNLRDRKIRPGKLKNTLAVQKAANKVLLICEVSKKSLQNVETGVKKILEIMHSSQTSNRGGKSSQSASSDKNVEKCYYFKYKSRTLRIKNKISLKHYTSVKIIATNMPNSIIDKYPVYYDCKLYRLRKKEKPDCDKKRDSDTNASDERNEKPRTTNESKSDHERHNFNPVCDVKQRTGSKKKWKHVSIINDSSDDDQISCDTKNDNVKAVLGPTSIKDSNDYILLDQPDNADTLQDCTDKESGGNRVSEDKNRSKSRDQVKKQWKHVNLIDDSSDDDRKSTDTKKDDSKEITGPTSPIKDSDNCNELDQPGNAETLQNSIDNESCQNIDKKDKNSSKSNDQENKPVIKCVSLSKLLKPDILKTNDSIIVIDDSPVPNKKTIMKHRLGGPSKNHTKSKSSLKEEKINEKEFWAQKRKEVAAFVSKKFSINLIRLPELTSEYLNSLSLKKITQNGFTVCEIADSRNTQFDNSEKLENCINETISDSETHMNDALIAEANKIKSSLLNMSDSDDSNLECNLTRKSSAKKVGTNKSDAEKVKKLLSIGSDSNSEENVEGNNKKSRDLLSQDANQQENEIGKNGNSTIYNNSLEVNPTIKPLMDEAEPKIDSEQVKKSLLVDSDSNDNVEPHIEDIIETSKTHSEAVCHEDETQNDDEKKAKNSNKQNKEIWNEGNYELKDKTPEKETSNTIGSDSELMNTPLSQRKKSASLTPQSKKKRMRESIEAKKMLLTHSSSSDTEDEQLRNALNEIKKSLLHGTDDEESSTKQVYQNQTKDSSSSTSDADVAKPKKRLRFSSSSSEESNRKKKCYREEKSSRRKMVRSKSKPGNCSSQNSDAHDSSDKDIDGLTNLDTLNKMKNRRRNSENSDTPEDTIASRPRRKPKPSGLICEEILKAETSSDAASGSADENEDCDGEVPTVTVPSFNGDGGHLVKEDLLGESDSSSSHNDESNNKEESEDDEKINSKRKKGILSSDSEVGSSRKKDTNVKSSDFEESDDDTEPSKRSKRKKVAESDASESGSSVDGSKKKRKRIKPLDSDVSGSDSENEGRNKHGRKNIRKVMGKNQLEEATKKAAREEKERIARIAERQKMYNNLEFDESGKPDEVVLEKVVLDFDPETKEPLIEVDRGLVKKLKPHQANGIKFMWDACFESAKRIKKDKGSGCILAHCMGLGKTLQVVTLTHTLLTHGEFTGVNRVLVVCPLSTVLNWVNEFNMWLKHAEADNDVDVYELSRFKQNSERAYQLSQWFTHGGVCVLGYEMFRNLSADNVKKFKKKMLKNFQESLVDPGPDLVVCDEGHLLKNEKTSLSQSMNRVKTLRRIVLTGTPLQNNLKEYYCMVQFVKPNLLGKYNEYLNRFVNPITNGQYTDSTEHDIKIMKRRSHVLHKMLDGAVQRRDYGVLAPFLPPKHEYVLFITLSEVQVKLYQHYLDNFSRRPQPGKSSGFLFPDFQSLQRIWTHPLVLKYNSERYEIMQQKKREREEEDSEGSLVDFIDDDSTPDESSTEESSDDSSIMSDDSRKKSKKKKSAKKSKGKDAKGAEGLARPRRGTRANPIDLEDDVKEEDDVIEVRNENPTEWWIKLVSDDELEDMRNSHKLILLFDILRQCDTIGDKLLVFSQSLYSLDLIEHFLGKVDEATQDGRIDEKLGGHVGSWSPGIDYFRLDGSTSCENRSIWCKNFNREDNPRARLFLISTRAGGLGINLVAANRVVIFDVSWNPSHDVQSIFRVYRFGQKKPCYVYRFLAMGTMEEKIYERQVTKQAISKRVIDEQQIDRHYAENDLAELYKFEPQPPVPRPIPPLPKDRLFAEMLREHEAQIYKYHEHDSLLENKEEETLSEEERKAAWEDFENEKNKPPPAPFPSPWPMHNGMMSGLLAQQQQQLAYAALAAMIRKDMPNVNDNQIRDMVPMLYNSNPQLMQKMSEMYKYTMNPMMNPGVMNPASGPGGMGSMSGASGLQYEPPWQRQQQQQQQMRLQQLMQQQNQMGAKFYAGGLGSRDPIAMALQQQRAREIMLGTSGGGGGGAGGAGAGRPRGRPPLQPRVPPPAHAARAPPGDVVNLDSD